jgi:transposase-like protein
MTKTRIRYTDEHRATLVAMLEMEGYPQVASALRKVATYAQIQPNVLRRWFVKKQNPPPNKLVVRKKKELAELFEDVAHTYLNRALDEDAISATAGQSAVIAAATATDKMRLLRGLPTEIVSLIPDVVTAIESMGQSPADFFNRIIQRAKQQSDAR